MGNPWSPPDEYKKAARQGTGTWGLPHSCSLFLRLFIVVILMEAGLEAA
ncbi:hypothetical protein [Paenibacillus taichungensis]|nr:hypothetical protein [Paenibacillus taichungensis]